jgi:2'-5' RNA ligase
MRLFVALDIEEGIRHRIRAFVEDVGKSAPKVRWVNPESLHVTLKFIGEKPDAMVKDIEAGLKSVRCQPFQLAFRGYGFFPTPRAARVFWVGIEAEEGLARLAKDGEESLAGLGIPKEKRAFSPHLTLARASGGSGAPGRMREDSPNRQFLDLQKHLEESAAPDFGGMWAREFFLYRSQVSSKGSIYTKIAQFELAADAP